MHLLQIVVTFIVLLATAHAYPAKDDITFIVAGKTANYRQSDGGAIRALNYHFFAEIFLTPEGKVTDAQLSIPGNNREQLVFTNGGYALEVHGGRYPTEQELELNYPDGSYLFQYSSPSTGRVNQSVNLANTKPGESSLPPAPVIALFQAGRPVAPHSINPSMDLRVSWSPFRTGRADPNGIMDDLVFVIVGDCGGTRRVHSGRPYEGTSYLTYADKHFTIPAGQLLSENVYQMAVEHAMLDTSTDRGVVAFATHATTTFLDITTTGTAPEGSACHRVTRGFDAGQTDRDR